MRPVVDIVRLPHNSDLPLPAYETAGAAGMDLRAAVSGDEALVLSPGTRAAVPTGLAFALPEGFEAQVRPRSGLALKAGVTVPRPHAPGILNHHVQDHVRSHPLRDPGHRGDRAEED